MCAVCWFDIDIDIDVCNHFGSSASRLFARLLAFWLLCFAMDAPRGPVPFGRQPDRLGGGDVRLMVWRRAMRRSKWAMMAERLFDRWLRALVTNLQQLGPMLRDMLLRERLEQAVEDATRQ